MNISYLAAALAGSLVLGNSLVNILASETMELAPEPENPEQYPYPEQNVSQVICPKLADEFEEFMLEVYTSTPRCATISSDDVMDLLSKPDYVTSSATYFGTHSTEQATNVTVMGVLTERGPAFIYLHTTATGKCTVEYCLPEGVKIGDYFIWDTPEWTIESLKRITNQILQINTAA